MPIFVTKTRGRQLSEVEIDFREHEIEDVLELSGIHDYDFSHIDRSEGMPIYVYNADEIGEVTIEKKLNNKGLRRRRPSDPDWVDFQIDFSQEFQIPQEMRRTWEQLEKQVQFSNHNSFRRGAEGTGLTTKEWVEICRKAEFRCMACGVPASEKYHLQIDHIVPIKQRGLHQPDNLLPLCSRCGATKISRLNKENGL